MPGDDAERYEATMLRAEQSWENLCNRCGACCGAAEGDPCEELLSDGDGTYRCRIYQDRYGLHRTKSGRTICCVPIRHILHKSWPGDSGCAYKREGRHAWPAGGPEGQRS